jgi:hypothetical protein
MARWAGELKTIQHVHPLLLKIEHTMYGKIAGFWVIISKTIKDRC